MKKIQWKVTTILVCIFLLFGLGICEKAFAQKGTPLVLRIALMGPSMGTQSEYLKKAVSEVEKLTEGRLKFEIYWSESLVKVKEMPKAIQRGVCDIAWTTSGYHPAEFPLWGHAQNILFLQNADDAGYLTRKAWELFDTSKDLRGDLEKLGQTAWFCTPYDAYPLFSKKVVKNLADLKGMRIKTFGEGLPKAMNAVGAHPTFISAAETYTALEKGIVDGAIAAYEWGKRYALYEVVPYVIDLKVAFGYAFFNVSLATLKKMSEKDRKTFLQVGRRVSIELGEAQKKEREEYKKFIQGKGVKILPFSDEQRQKWADMPEVKALPKNWIEQQNAAKRPGAKVMREFLTVFELPQYMPAGY